MRFSHLGLPVRDERRSQEFRSDYFGFDLALHPVEHIEPSPAFLHAGFRAAAPADVRKLMGRMEAAGVTIVERNDEASYTAFKCPDPDGAPNRGVLGAAFLLAT